MFLKNFRSIKYFSVKLICDYLNLYLEKGKMLKLQSAYGNFPLQMVSLVREESRSCYCLAFLQQVYFGSICIMN